MQQAIYSPLALGTTARPAPVLTRRPSLARWIARRWDFVGILTLMGSSAAYGIWALAHAV